MSLGGKIIKGCNPWIWMVKRILFHVQNPLSSLPLYKNIKIKIYITVALPVILLGRKTWSLTLGE